MARKSDEPWLPHLRVLFVDNFYVAYKRLAGRRVRTRYKVPIRPLTCGRLTVPSKSGKQWPILFGIGATSVLMYVALRYGCTAREIRDALQISNAAWQNRSERLRHFGLLVYERRFRSNSLNKKFKHYKELRDVLVRLAEHYGMEAMSDKPRRIPHFVRPRKAIPIPIELFHSPMRGKILILVASLHETYAQELATAGFFRFMGEVGKQLRKLEREGVLSSRSFNQATIFRINPEYCAAKELTTLLRRMATSMPEMRTAVQAAYFRREVISASGGIRERRLVASLGTPTKSIPGGNRYRAERIRPKIVPFVKTQQKLHPMKRKPKE